MSTKNGKNEEKKAASKGPKSLADRLKAQGFEASRESITLIEPEALSLIRDEKHPLYDPRVEWPVDPNEAFYKDIKARGVTDPVKVRRNGVDKQGRDILQVVDGRQRVQTLMHLNAHEPLPDGKKRKLKVLFVDGDDKAMILISLASNSMRKDETPFSRAVKMKMALEQGASREEVAQACGWGTPAYGQRQVEQHLALLSMVPEVQQAFNTGGLPIGALGQFATVPREEQAEVLATVTASGAKTGTQVKAAVAAARNGEAYVAPEKSEGRTPRMWNRDKVDLLRQKLEAKRSDVLPIAFQELDACIALLTFLLGDATKLEKFPHLQSAVAEVAAVG